MDESTQSLLESREPEERVHGLRLVELDEDGDAAPLAKRLLERDPYPEVREHAARALGVALGGESVAALRHSAKSDTEPLVRRTALAVLGEIGDSAAAAALETLVRDGLAVDRAVALDALRAAGDPARAAAAADLLGDEDAHVRALALHTVVALQGLLPHEVGEAGRGRRAAAPDGTLEPHRTALATVAAAVAAEGPLWALPAAALVRGEAPEAAVAREFPRARGHERERAVLRALELPRAASPGLLGFFVGVEDRAASFLAARELARRGDARGAPVLARALLEGEGRALDAASGLAELGLALGEPLLRRALAREGSSDRALIARALARLLDPAGVPALGLLLSGDVPQDRRQAALGFAELGRADGALELVRALDHAFRRERAEALAALRGLWPEGPPISPLASRPDRAPAVAAYEARFARRAGRS